MLRAALNGIIAAALAGVAWAAAAQQSSASFPVNITLTPSPSVCATQKLTGRAGSTARVACLTSGIPSFNTPGRQDFTAVGIGAASAAALPTFPGGGGTTRRVETAAQVASSMNVNSLSAAAAGDAVSTADATPAAAPGSTEAGGDDNRSVRGAEFRSDQGSAPPQEIEVSF